VAREFFDRGFSRQKWFFFNGPVDGAEGLKQNIALAEALREELGSKALLMFDGIQYVWKSSDVDYAIALAKGLLPIKPHWLEEPLRPDDLEGYVRLKGETMQPLSLEPFPKAAKMESWSQPLSRPLSDWPFSTKFSTKAATKVRKPRIWNIL
jgi:L-alanine-DL-glutamate epimerase-like enolase superfamily enzyme